MDLPISPPTDNLYKFAAISGLLAAVALFMFTILMVDHLQTDVDALRADVAVIGAQLKTLRDIGTAVTSKEEWATNRARAGRVRGKDCSHDRQK